MPEPQVRHEVRLQIIILKIQLLHLSQRQIFGAGGAIIQKKNKEKEKGKGKEERREKRKKERGEFNLEDPMFPI